MLPQALTNAIDALAMLPGVGPKTAERYAYFLFKSNERVAEGIAEALAGLHTGV
ncbi:recombination protein RecR, partial [Candidatus Saccharibacteria bacterium]|nr:recombination protein RecR [Candidatus Saccharibacteria bacterium]